MGRIDGKKGIITLSFDDARKDTYHVMKDILKPRGLPGVVYVPSGYVETGYHCPEEIGYNGLMTKAELDDIAQDPLFEIGAHGYMHQNDLDDVRLGLEKLQEWYPEIKRFGFASPHSVVTKSQLQQMKKEYERLGFAYVRSGRNFERFILVQRMFALLARITRSPALFRMCYANSVNKEIGYYLHAVPVHQKTTLKQLVAIVRWCCQKGYWAIFEFHGIDYPGTKEYGEIFCWSEPDFVLLCDYLAEQIKEGQLMVETPGNVTKRLSSVVL